MKKLLIPLFLVFSLTLGGCSAINTAAGNVNSALGSTAGVNYTVDATILAVSYKKLDPLLVQAKADVEANMGKFSPKDQAQLTAIIAEIQGTMDQIHSMVSGKDSAGQIVVKLTTIQSIYESAKTAYLQARTIISANYSKLPSKAQTDLSALDALSTQMDASLQQLYQAPKNANVTALLNNILNISATIATIAQAGA